MSILLCISALLTGCVVAADYKHFELDSFKSKNYDNSNITWCFTFPATNSLEVCSPAYHRRSKSIGLIIPVIPQANRNSRLAYDIKGDRRILLKNKGSVKAIRISDLAGIKSCTEEYKSACSYVESVILGPGDFIWLKLPVGKFHEFTVSVEGGSFTAKLVETSATKWHSVSV